MRYFLVFVLLVFSGCSAGWHIKRAEQIEPGIFKPTIEYRDTIIKLDTLISIDFSDFLDIDTTPNIVYETEYIDKVVKISASFDTIINVNRGLTAKFWMNKGRFGAKFEIDSSYIFHLEDSIKGLNKIITNTVIIENKATFKDYFKEVGIIVILILFIILMIVIFRR